MNVPKRTFTPFGLLRLQNPQQRPPNGASSNEQPSEPARIVDVERQKYLTPNKRVSIGDLLTAGLVREGDQWRLSAKGEVVWGRLESNGQLEVNGEGHGNPSKAFQAGTGLPGNGWYYWHYRDANGEWQRIDALRSEYRRQVERVNLTLVQDAKPDTA